MKPPCSFSVDDKVQVNKCSEYRNRYCNVTGVVEKTFFRNSRDKYIIGVRLDNKRNSASATGVFWFKPSSLRLSESVEEDIHFNFESEEISMFENFKVAEVELYDNPCNSILFAMYEDFNVDDRVVVNVSGSFQVGTILEITEGNDAIRSQIRPGDEVVCSVNFTAYEYRKESRKRAKELKKKMDKKLKEMQSMAVYEMFADKDPEMKAMLDEFKALKIE